jgi:3-oxoacyl-[acyl-carrier-protein] synthase III
MFIHATGQYVPQRSVDNEYFSQLTGRPAQWFEKLTGIRSRRRAGAGENASSMAIAAVQDLLTTAPGALADVDLIIGASYTPWDTIGTMAHVLQRRFELSDAKAMYLSTACSSFIDAVEVAAAYFDSGRARRALVVAAEHNSLYSSDSDEKSGHLWGDGAAAVVLDKSAGEPHIRIADIITRGLADRGHGPEAISLVPHAKAGGLVMPHGKDIFVHASREMVHATREMLRRNQLSLDQIKLLIPHQANKRIIDHVCEELGIPPQRVALTITELGNTGCASVAITLHRHLHRLEPGDRGILVTFGGGYSSGAVLIERH